MTEITAAMVKELRESTSAGMLDCKKLWSKLRAIWKKPLTGCAKGPRFRGQKKQAALPPKVWLPLPLKVTRAPWSKSTPETDFVAKNEIFQEYVEDAALVALMNNGELCDMKNFQCPKVHKSFEERLTDMIAKIGENMNLRRAKVVEVSEGVVAPYVHNVARNNLGKIGVLVALESTADKAKLAELGKHIAMHIAASQPQF